jgi:CRISPR-associated endoribonuclease Cas6
LDCIENIYFKQITAVTLNLKNNKNTIIGSKWKFKIKKDITPLNMKFIQFNFDSGFGQKTAMGFGCMNRILNKEKKHVQIKHKTKV